MNGLVIVNVGIQDGAGAFQQVKVIKQESLVGPTAVPRPTWVLPTEAWVRMEDHVSGEEWEDLVFLSGIVYIAWRIVHFRDVGCEVEAAVSHPPGLVSKTAHKDDLTQVDEGLSARLPYKNKEY